MKKKCRKCVEVKPLEEFYKDKSKKDGASPLCKCCQSAMSKEYYKANKEKLKAKTKAHYEANKEEALAYGKAWRKSNKEKLKVYAQEYRVENLEAVQSQKKAWYEANKEKVLAKHSKYKKENAERAKAKNKEYYEANKEKIVAKNRVYRRKRRANNPILLLRDSYSEAVRRGFKLIMKSKECSALDYLGCSWEYFVSHLESQFYDRLESTAWYATTGEKMTLDNYGFYGWHLDHIIPLDTSKTEEDVKRLSHYTNFQPLWAEDNLAKSNKILDKFRLLA